MSTLGKVTLGLMGKLRPAPVLGDAPRELVLPAAHPQGGLPLYEALAARRSARAFAPDALPLPVLSQLPWAAYGVNRPDGGRTAPSALNAQEVELYVALPVGAYRYDAGGHALKLAAAADIRRVTGYRDFVDDAPLDLVFVADYSRLRLVPAAQREAYAALPRRFSGFRGLGGLCLARLRGGGSRRDHGRTGHHASRGQQGLGAAALPGARRGGSLGLRGHDRHALLRLRPSLPGHRGRLLRHGHRGLLHVLELGHANTPPGPPWPMRRKAARSIPQGFV